MSIDGVLVVPLPRFCDERGAVYRMLRSTDEHFVGFGEIYFSAVFPGVVKAWKRHRRITANLACVSGSATVVLYDDRERSPTVGSVLEVVLGPDDYSLVVVPPGVWHGFRGCSEPLALLANCSSEAHDPDEFERREPSDPDIPYAW